MRIKEILEAMASWLESPDNSAMLLSEYDENCLNVVATSCVEAAAILKKAALEVDSIEEHEPIITEESIEQLGALASILDGSNDPDLQKQASVIDQLLLTVGADPNFERNFLAQREAQIEDYKKKFKAAKAGKEESSDLKAISDSKEDIKKSPVYKDYEVLEAALSTRYCPDHAGALVSRVGEQQWQCELDKKTYDFNAGFTLANGKKVPGSNVSNQTQTLDISPESLFSTRESHSGNR